MYGYGSGDLTCEDERDKVIRDHRKLLKQVVDRLAVIRTPSEVAKVRRWLIGEIIDHLDDDDLPKYRKYIKELAAQEEGCHDET